MCETLDLKEPYRLQRSVYENRKNKNLKTNLKPKPIQLERVAELRLEKGGISHETQLFKGHPRSTPWFQLILFISN